MVKRKGKIALCFLITREPQNWPVWLKWMEGHEENISLYFHFSRNKEHNIHRDVFWDNRVKPVPTKWGDVSLVYAEGELYKKAIKDKENLFFVMLSESDIPVRPFSVLWKRLMRDQKRGIVDYRRLDAYNSNKDEHFKPFVKSKRCTKRLVKERIVDAPLYTSAQWKALSRPNAEIFIKMLTDKKLKYVYEHCITVVPDSLAPDEFAYINYLKFYGSIRSQVRLGAITFYDFDDKAIHPLQYTKISPELRKDICHTNTIFARKFVTRLHILDKQVPLNCSRE